MSGRDRVSRARFRLCRETSRVPAQSQNVPVSYPLSVRFSPSQATLFAHLQGFCASPLTDSNRRPPPYHVLPDATGGRRWQRNSLVFAVPRASRFAAGCHRLRPRGSITAPSVSAKLRVERPAVGCLQVAALGAFTPREDSQRCRRSFDGPLPDGPDPACRPARHCPN